MSTLRYIGDDGWAVYGPEGVDDPMRYELARWLLPPLLRPPLDRARKVCFLMLNGSTATHLKPDPTVTRCVGYGTDWGYELLLVGNLFGYRTAFPTDLREAHARGEDVVGPENDAFILSIASSCDMVIAAWGTNGSLGNRDQHVLALLHRAGIPLRALGVNADGSPGHPLYLSASKQPVPWTSARGIGDFSR